MIKIKSLLIVTLTGLILTACQDSSNGKKANKKTNIDNNPIVKIVANAANGKLYYLSQCASCHSAGDDRSTAFGSVDLAQKQDRIQTDMSDQGGVSVDDNGISVILPLMGRFTNIRAQRVADLKAYLSTL